MVNYDIEWHFISKNSFMKVQNHNGTIISIQSMLDQDIRNHIQTKFFNTDPTWTVWNRIKKPGQSKKYCNKSLDPTNLLDMDM